MAWWRLPRRTEQRALTLEQVLTDRDNTETFAGVDVSSDQALRLSAVWACVRLLGDTISTLPVDVYRRGERDPLPTPPLLVEPAAGQPLHDWLYAVVASLLLRGNAYGLVTARSGATLLPSQVELVNPDSMVVTTNADGRLEYRVGSTTYAREDVWHVRAYPMPGAVLGLSPISYARQAIGLGLAVERFGASFFGDGATPSGVLTTETKLTRESADALKAQWKAAHGRRRDVAILTGDLKFQAVSVTPEESQFIESRRLTVAEVCRVFGVPPEMVAADSGGSLTYANVEQRSLDFLTYSVGPWLKRLEVALSGLLPRSQVAKFNAGALLRTTTKTRYEAHEIGLRAGFLTRDEVRALEDLPPLDDDTRGAVA